MNKHEAIDLRNANSLPLENRMTRFATPLACFGVGLILRLWNLGEASLWLDEIHSITESADFSHILTNKGNGFGYFVLLHAMREWLGTTAFSLRILSAVGGAFSIPIAWMISQRLTRSAATSFVVAIVISALPLLLIHSREARMYSLWTSGIWLCVLSILYLDHPRWRNAALITMGLSLVTCFSFHNFSVFYWIAIVLFWSFYRGKQIALKELKMEFAIVAVLPCLLGALLLLRLAWLVPNGELMKYLVQYASPPWWDTQKSLSGHFAAMNLFGHAGSSKWVFVWIGAWCIAMAAFVVRPTLHKRGAPRAVGSLAILFLVPLILFAVLPIRNHARLMLPLCLFLYLPLCWILVESIPDIFPKARYLLVLALTALLFPGAITAVHLEKEPWNNVCQYVGSLATADAHIWVWPRHTNGAFQFCYRGKGTVVDSPIDIESTEPPPSPAWLVFAGSHGIRSGGFMEKLVQRLKVTQCNAPNEKLRIFGPDHLCGGKPKSSINAEH
jgi:hypothetical protein